MIIPIKCFTCGKVLANKYLFYIREVRKKKLANMGEIENEQIDNIVYLTKQNITKTPEGHAMDELGLTRMCCRRHLLTHVDIE
jgi:DNA-directed RNA polymerase I, II, and III subunit RPABC5